MSEHANGEDFTLDQPTDSGLHPEFDSPLANQAHDQSQTDEPVANDHYQSNHSTREMMSSIQASLETSSSWDNATATSLADPTENTRDDSYLQTVVDELVETNNDQSQRIQLLERESLDLRNRYEAELAALTAQFSEAQATIQSLKEQASAHDLKQEIDALLASAKAKESELSYWKTRSSELEEKLAAQASEVTSADTGIPAISHEELAGLHVEITRLREQLSEKDRALASSKTDAERLMQVKLQAFATEQRAQNQKLQAALQEGNERENQLRTSFDRLTKELADSKAENQRTTDQVVQASLKQQELLHLREVIREFAEREQYIEALEERIAAYEKGQGPDHASATLESVRQEELAGLRHENHALQAQITQLTNEMQAIVELRGDPQEMESLRREVLRLSDLLQARQIEIAGLNAELDRARTDRDAELQALRNDLANSEAQRSKSRIDQPGLSELWSTRASTITSAASAPRQPAAPKQQTPIAEEGPTSIDERIRAFRQHLDSLEDKKPVANKRGGLFRIFGRG